MAEPKETAGKEIKARITLTLYDDNNVVVRCEGDTQLCTAYMAMVEMFTKLMSSAMENLRGRLGGVPEKEE